MSCLFKIEQANLSFTDTEKRIAEFITNNPTNTTRLSAAELAEKINTSPAAVIRFSKKIGYSGFTDLKMSLATNHTNEENDVDTLIQAGDSIEMLIEKSKRANMLDIEQTYKLISVTNIAKSIELLKKARRIYLCGVGASGLVCSDFYHKLTRIDKCVIFGSDPQILMARVAHISKEDVMVAISYSGESADVLTQVMYAREMGATIIGITRFDNHSSLFKNADILLHIPTVEKELRLGAISSRNSSFIITDLLFYGIAKDNLSDTKKSLLKTSKLTQKSKIRK